MPLSSKTPLSGSVFNDVFNNGEVHWVEIYKEDKMLARGILAGMDVEKGEFYMENGEEEIKACLNKNREIIPYKGHYDRC